MLLDRGSPVWWGALASLAATAVMLYLARVMLLRPLPGAGARCTYAAGVRTGR